MKDEICHRLVEYDKIGIQSVVLKFMNHENWSDFY